MRKFIIFIGFAMVFALVGCDKLPVYQPSAQQGNYVTDSMLNQLYNGMNRSQVENIMGSPILQNMFALDRVHYVYILKPSRGKMTKKCVTLIFYRGRLTSVNRNGCDNI